jgi:two-component sensor histidine kinase
LEARWDAQSQLRESHHRINNHLQILASLIGLQARAALEPATREALMQVRRRILAIARLHAELQTTEDEEVVDISRFFMRLGEDFRLTFGADETDGVRLVFEVEPARLPTEQVVTIALMVNELVNNAVKHATLARGGGGEVRVSLRRELGGWRLTVADDGPGLAADAFEQAEGHGLGLVRLLAQKLKGSVQVDTSDAGASISAFFV